jgi:hypothetical protein
MIRDRLALQIFEWSGKSQSRLTSQKSAHQGRISPGRASLILRSILSLLRDAFLAPLSISPSRSGPGAGESRSRASPHAVLASFRPRDTEKLKLIFRSFPLGSEGLIDRATLQRKIVVQDSKDNKMVSIFSDGGCSSREGNREQRAKCSQDKKASISGNAASGLGPFQ